MCQVFANIFAIHHRMAIVWRRMFINFLMLRIIEPSLFLYGLGFGLGLAYTEINGTPYLNWVIPGILCSTLMFACFLDGGYGTFSRSFFIGLWPSILATPIPLWQIMLADAAWSGIKVTAGLTFVFLIGWLFGGIEHPERGILLIPVLWFAGTALAMLGQVFSSRAKGYEDFDYLWAVALTPMLIFSGVFIPITVFPEWLQAAMQIYPITHLLVVVRGILLGTESLLTIALNILVIAGMFAIAFPIAYRKFYMRLQG